MTLFRVHYADGFTTDVDADRPDNARLKALEERKGIITKVKVVKEKAEAHG
jgi:hypothetical protein